MLEVYAQNVFETLVNRYGVTIPWEQILEMVLQLLDGCFDSESDFVNAAKNPTVLQRVGMRVVARRHLNVSSRKVVNCCDVMLDQASQMDPVYLAGAYQEGKAVFSARGGN